jgi:hypothetical protein
VPAGEERNQYLLDDFILTNNDFAEFLEDALAPFLNFGG